MFLSMKYEAKEATDTITQLVAVLDTNFWLATHVTIINIGYAAGLVSAIIALIYLPAKLIGTLRGKPNKEFYRTLTRMNYGVICFCLFFPSSAPSLEESGRITAEPLLGLGTPRKTELS